MATKVELAAEAAELAAELKIEVATEDLSHAELTALVADLEARYEAQLGGDDDVSTEPPPAPEPPVPPAPKPPVDGASDGALGGPPPKAAPVVEPPKGAYVVAPGKSLLTRAGPTGPGGEVRARD